MSYICCKSGTDWLIVCVIGSCNNILVARSSSDSCFDMILTIVPLSIRLTCSKPQTLATSVALLLQGDMVENTAPCFPTWSPDESNSCNSPYVIELARCMCIDESNVAHIRELPLWLSNSKIWKGLGPLKGQTLRLSKDGKFGVDDGKESNYLCMSAFILQHMKYYLILDRSREAKPGQTLPKVLYFIEPYVIGQWSVLKHWARLMWCCE